MHIIDMNNIKAGDIILMRSDSENSRRVRALTGSSYSHAVLYVGAGSCIESDGPGVQSQNIQRLLFEKPEYVKILRLKKSSTAKIPDAIVYARQKIGTEYSLSEARGAVSQRDDKAMEPNRQFCSRFVAKSFESAGIKLVQNPDYCTPEDILQSPLLTEVENFLRKASNKEIEFAKSESPLLRQAKIHNEIFKSARTIFKSDIQTFDQLSRAVLENPDKEPAITKVIEESGYLTMWETDLKENPWHYDPDQMIKHYRNPRQVLEVAMFFATSEKSTRLRFEQTVQAMRLCYDISKLKYFEQQVQLCEKLIELSIQRETTGFLILTQAFVSD